MNPKTLFTTVAFAALATSGLLLAQVTSSARHRTGNLAHMATDLGLTDQQKSQANAIFQESHAAAAPIRQNLLQEKASVQAAIQAGKPAGEIQQLARSEGPSLAQLVSIHAAASAKFYAMLSPDQQQKLIAMRQSRHANRTAGQ